MTGEERLQRVERMLIALWDQHMRIVRVTARLAGVDPEWIDREEAYAERQLQELGFHRE